MAGELVTLLPQGIGGAGVLALFGWYSKTSRDDRREYREALAAREAALASGLAEAKAEFTARLADEHARLVEAEAEAHTEIEDLRRRLADAETIIVAERAARRGAELDAEGHMIRLEHAMLRLRIARGEDVDAH